MKSPGYRRYRLFSHHLASDRAARSSRQSGSPLSRPAAVATIAALGLATGISHAQVLDEVIVTAQKREQSVQDVGISINAFTGDQMKALGVQDSFDIATFAPGVHISGNLAGQNTQFSIRGVTQNDFNDIIEAPNAVYIDETYIPIAQGQTFGVFDIERVEILKGPQGTLFGRNATGGMVQYISRKPNMEEVEGYIDTSFGIYDSDANANEYRVEAAVSGPLGDNTGGRIAVLYNQRDGYLDNIYPFGEFGAGSIGASTSNSPGPGAGADMGDDDTIALRGILQFEPSDRLAFTFSVNYASTEVATGPYQSKPTIGVYDGSGPVPGGAFPGELVNVIDVAPGETRRSICADGTDCGSDQDNNGQPDDFVNNATGAPPPDGLADLGRIGAGGDFFGYIDPDGEDFTTSGDFAFADQGSIDTYGLTGRIEWAISDSVSLTSITDFKDFEKLLFIDVDSAPVNQSANYAGVDATSFTQELRLNGESDIIRWVAGVYYLNIDTDSDNGLKFPVNGLVPGAFSGIPGDPFDLGSDAQLETNSYSVFGQLERDLTDQLTFIIGGRLIREEKDYRFTQSLYPTQDSNQIHQGTPILIGPDFSSGVPAAFTDSTSDNLWAGKIQLDWRPNDDLLLYAGINRGVKAGSFNAQLAGGLPVPTSAIPYGEEELLSYEVGFKSSFSDGRTRLNGSVFYYDYNDYQAFLFTGVGGVVINADANTLGAELEVQSSPIDGLDVMLSLSVFDATVEDVPFRVDGPISKDVDPVYAPEIQIAGLARYEWPIASGMLSIQGDFSYSDQFYYNLRNFDADKYDSYVLVNASFGWTSADENWYVGLSLRNLTDERAGIQGFDLATLCGCNEISFRAPRQYLVNAKYQF